MTHKPKLFHWTYCSSSGKKSACDAGDQGSIPGSERSSGEGNSNPLQYSCLENFMDREAWRLQFVGSQRLGHNWATNTHTTASYTKPAPPGFPVSENHNSIFVVAQTHWRFPDSSVGKEPTCNAGDPGSIPGSGRPAGEGIGYALQYSWVFLMSLLVSNWPAMRETWVPALSWEDPLQKGKATHSSILTWRVP